MSSPSFSSLKMAPPSHDLPESEILALISRLRTEFTQSYACHNPDKYDERDLDRVELSDDWVRMFLLHKKLDIKNAASMMDLSLAWRKEFGVNDIREEGIPIYYRDLGAVYFHNKNKSGNAICHFRIRLNKRGDAEHNLWAKRMIVFQLETHQRLYTRDQVVALLDMTAVGMANVDIDLTRFLITCFTKHFPGMLEYLLVFDMPWVVNAVWTIVKRVLSEEEQKHVIFCKRNTIQQYVEPDQLYTHMGGRDTSDFRYVATPAGDTDVSPADELTQSFIDSEEQVPPAGAGDVTQQPSSDTMDSKPIRRVNFAVNDDVKVYDPSPENPANHQPGTSASTDRQSNDSPSVNERTDARTASAIRPSELDVEGTASPVNGHAPDSSNPHSSQPASSTLPKDQSVAAKSSSQSSSSSTSPSAAKHHHHAYTKYSLNVIPSSELEFSRTGINREASCTITLANPHSIPVIYKIKITDPKNYRVKPSAGVLTPNAESKVHVVLLAGKEIKRDRFLILSAELTSTELSNNSSQSQLNAHWKALHEAQIHQYKLRCHEELVTEPELVPAPNCTAPASVQREGSDVRQLTTARSFSPLLSSITHRQNSAALTIELQSINERCNTLQDSIHQLKVLLTITISLLVIILACLLVQ